MVSCLMGDSTALASAIVRCCPSKNSNSNWGLGLYYVRTIVKKHMGTLKVESIYGSGASFYILLPKILPERGQKRGKVHEHPHHRGGGQ